MLTSRSLAVAAVLAASATTAPAAELITNGGFEVGGLAGWTVTDLAGGSGSFFAQPNDGTTLMPLSGIPAALVNPGGGTTFAVSDQTGPGTHALTQAFTTPGSFTSLALTFDMFMNDFSSINPTVDPSGLDHTTGGTFAPNQHARVDILSATAGAFSTAPADIVTSILAPVPGAGAGPNPWISSPLFDLSALLAPGTSYQIRFAEVDNSGFLNLGVDNVSISALSSVPVPAGLPLILTALGALGIFARRRAA